MNFTKNLLLACLFGGSIQAIDVTLCNKTAALIWHHSEQSKVSIEPKQKTSLVIKDGDKIVIEVIKDGDKIVIEGVVYTLKREGSLLEISSESPFSRGGFKLAALREKEVHVSSKGEFSLFGKEVAKPLR